MLSALSVQRFVAPELTIAGKYSDYGAYKRDAEAAPVEVEEREAEAEAQPAAAGAPAPGYGNYGEQSSSKSFPIPRLIKVPGKYGSSIYAIFRPT